MASKFPPQKEYSNSSHPSPRPHPEIFHPVTATPPPPPGPSPCSCARPRPWLAAVHLRSPCTAARAGYPAEPAVIEAPGRRRCLAERRKPVGPSSPTPVATPPPLPRRRPHPRSSPHRRPRPRSSPHRRQLAGASHIGGSSIWRMRRRPCIRRRSLSAQYNPKPSTSPGTTSSLPRTGAPKLAVLAYHDSLSLSLAY